MREFTATVIKREDLDHLLKVLRGLINDRTDENTIIHWTEEFIKLFSLEDVAVRYDPRTQRVERTIQNIELDFHALLNLRNQIGCVAGWTEATVSQEFGSRETFTLNVFFTDSNLKTIFVQKKKKKKKKLKTTVTDVELENLRRTAEKYMRIMRVQELGFSMISPDEAEVSSVEMTIHRDSNWFGQ